ncbi:MAG: NFACT RNA binding domain-containing protein [Myxococcota bacterium]
MKAKVERVDQPEPGLLSLTIREDRKNSVLLISALPGALAVGLVNARPRGRAATPTLSQLRRHIEGAILEGVAKSNRVVMLQLVRGPDAKQLVVVPRKPLGAWWLAGADGKAIVQSAGASVERLAEGHHLRGLERAELVEAGVQIHEAHRAAREAEAGRRLDRRRKRLERKRAAIEADLERARDADELHEKATLLLAYVSQIPPNSTSFDALTWDEKPRTVRIELESGKTGPETAESLFKKAKRLRRGLDVAPNRLSLVDQDLTELANLRLRLEAGELESVLEALGEPGHQSVTPQTNRSSTRRRSGERRPYREFLGAHGMSILVGRSAADNDRLTLRVAKPHDVWLHARGVTGAHVVVPLDKGKSCPPETLVDAATLAAHFSDLRRESTVDVLYTSRRFVHKRKGAPVGSVTLGKEKVIAVRVEDTRLARLLDAESRA